MIISTKELSKTTEAETFNQCSKAEDINHEFFISKGYKDFVKQLSELEQNKQYSFVSFGQWSLKHVVFHLLKLCGRAEVFSTTYGLGPSSARGIISGIKSGLISDFNFLYDNKIRTYKIEAHDLCASNFPVKIAANHSKITVLLNEIWGVTITGSANWSDSNNKIETTVISTNRKLAEFHKDWISKAMKTKSVEPKKILEEINSSFITHNS